MKKAPHQIFQPSLLLSFQTDAAWQVISKAKIDAMAKITHIMLSHDRLKGEENLGSDVEKSGEENQGEGQFHGRAPLFPTYTIGQGRRRA